MKKALQTLNDLEAAGLVTRYAIGGAMGLAFYTEAALTYHLDVFVLLPPASRQLVALTPIYEFLKARGCGERQEHVLIAGLPVQFLPAFDPLVEEGLREAVDKTFTDVPTRVLRLEHLMAIMLKTGRPKDLARLAEVVRQTPFETARFDAVLDRHSLRAAWDCFRAVNP